MNEKHVTSLSLSIKLKELGVKQESEFYWVLSSNEEYFLFDKLNNPELFREKSGWKYCSAFLASELGEMLPDFIQKDKKMYILMGRKDLQYLNNSDWDEITPILRESTETNARAAMLIFLIENKLIKLDS